MVRPYASQAARSLAPRPPVLAGAFAPVHAHPGPNEVHDRPQNREAEKAPGDGPDRKEPQPAGWTTTASRSSRGCCCCDSLVRPLGGLRVRRACLRPRAHPAKRNSDFRSASPRPGQAWLRGCAGAWRSAAERRAPRRMQAWEALARPLTPRLPKRSALRGALTNSRRPQRNVPDPHSSPHRWTISASAPTVSAI